MSAPAPPPGGTGDPDPGTGDPDPGTGNRDRGTGRITAAAEAIRRILAAATGQAEMLRIPADAPLFGEEVGLDSLTGTQLLCEIKLRFGVDVAGEDLNLDSLATLHTLATFVAERVPEGTTDGAGGEPHGLRGGRAGP